MTDFAALLHPDRGQPARTLHLVAKDALDEWLAAQPERVRTAVAAQRFAAKPGEFAILPGDAADDWSAAAGAADRPGPYALAAAVAKLPGGTYRVEGPHDGALGWLLAQHRFTRYRASPDPQPERILLTADVGQIDHVVRLAEAVALVRDMVDTPAADMGPAEIAAEAERLATRHGAMMTVTSGAALAQGYPMIHAVGRAASLEHQPRLIELEWGDPAHPKVAIVGKGVCFDSGGLDIKPSSGMRLMKKDMGGAAHAIALAGLVMAAGLPVRLHLLVAAVENAISADAFRPGDVLASRKGLSVEIGNTDAEGRLVLGDALTRACEGQPALMLDFATLTGAARVALGPDLPALFANDDVLAAELLAAGDAVGDPLWRLPLWDPYADMLKSDIADLNNAAEGGFAGSITAALFLKRFVGEGVAWAHFDTFAWTPATRPGRPRGGEALGLRAAWEMLRRRFPAA
jgi:leucyl aminopeptidase